MERRKPGPVGKGDRCQMNVLLPRALFEATRKRATAKGMTLTDYIGELVSADTGVPYDVQEGLKLGA